jgi:hypothetical protein
LKIRVKVDGQSIPDCVKHLEIVAAMLLKGQRHCPSQTGIPWSFEIEQDRIVPEPRSPKKPCGLSVNLLGHFDHFRLLPISCIAQIRQLCEAEEETAKGTICVTYHLGGNRLAIRNWNLAERCLLVDDSREDQDSSVVMASESERDCTRPAASLLPKEAAAQVIRFIDWVELQQPTSLCGALNEICSNALDWAIGLTERQMRNVPPGSTSIEEFREVRWFRLKEILGQN